MDEGGQEMGDTPSRVDIGATYRIRDRALIFSIPPHDQHVNVATPAADFFRLIGIGPKEAGKITEGLPDKELEEEDEAYRDLKRAALDAAGLRGARVLDAGGYDGYAAKYALDQGAAAVTVLDNGQYLNYNWKLPERIGGVRYIGGDVLEWQERADVLIAGGLIYHMQDPWRALWHFRCLAKTLVLWTSVIDNPEPVWRVCDPDEAMANQERIWDDRYTMMWLPSITGVERLLKRTGWTEVTQIGQWTDRVAWVAR